MKKAFTLEEERLYRDEYIAKAFKMLRVPGMATFYREVIEGIEDVQGLDAATIIEKLVDAEMMSRSGNKGAKLIQAAKLWYPQADLSDLKGNNAALDVNLVSTLSKCGFIEAGAFVIITGRPKSGTTYLGCAIAASACRLAYKTTYKRYFDLMLEITQARSDGSLSECLEKYRKAKCLVIDDWMNTSMGSSELTFIKEIIDYRSQYGGTILISHSLVDEWPELLDSHVQGKISMIETITHGATIINI